MAAAICINFESDFYLGGSQRVEMLITIEKRQFFNSCINVGRVCNLLVVDAEHVAYID
jgi:hypothetical protein